MLFFREHRSLFALVVAIVVFAPIPAYAYIDLGLAGQVFQLLYVILFGALALVVAPFLFFWRQIKRGAQRLFVKQKADERLADE